MALGLRTGRPEKPTREAEMDKTWYYLLPFLKRVKNGTEFTVFRGVLDGPEEGSMSEVWNLISHDKEHSICFSNPVKFAETINEQLEFDFKKKGDV